MTQEAYRDSFLEGPGSLPGSGLLGSCYGDLYFKLPYMGSIVNKMASY